MRFRSRKIVRDRHLNHNNTLFGGTLLAWLDEEAAIYVACQLGTPRIVTKLISEIDFVAPAGSGDVVEIGVEATHFGRTSITLRAEVRNKTTQETILIVDKMVFVSVDAYGAPDPHGRTEVLEDDLSPSPSGAS